MQVLDLFCGMGGASVGYAMAGLDIVAGIDMSPSQLSRYPYDGHLMDWRDGLEKYAAEADLISASPPCQGYSTATPAHARPKYPDIMADVREALRATGKPYVIENVQRAPLINPVTLCGCMFGLTVEWDTGIPGNPTSWGLRRLRDFEVHGFELAQPDHVPGIHHLPTIPVIQGTTYWFRHHWNITTVTVDVKRRLMRTEWMTKQGTGESIPPAYAEYIGRSFLASF